MRPWWVGRGRGRCASHRPDVVSVSREIAEAWLNAPGVELVEEPSRKPSRSRSRSSGY